MMSAPRLPLSARPRKGGRARLIASSALAGSLALALGSAAQAAPVGGVVVAGQATLSGPPGDLVITQSTQNAAMNWQGFGIAAGESVRFAQPNAQAVALNRVLGADPSLILGRLSANGKVFLVNPNGVLFGSGAQVNVGGLVASTLQISDADFMAGRYRFSAAGPGAVRNDGQIVADGGSVALLGAQVNNQGVISATLGAVSLAAGEAITLDVAGDGLLQVTVDQGALHALAENGGLIRAEGGRVLMTARSASDLIRTAVNNTGVIEAHSLESRGGVIALMGDMGNGVVNVGGVLDASAPGGGDGGFIETSAASVIIADTARVTTAATSGRTGTWLIDPQDFYIEAGKNISGATLSALLVTNSVVITTSTGALEEVAGTPPTTTYHTATPGFGDIYVNDAVSWTATPSTTTLTLRADQDVYINAAITAVNGNLVVCCARDITIDAAITTTRGSVLMDAGGDITLTAVGAMTTTNGNIELCSAQDLIIRGAMTLNNGTTIAARSLGIPAGMVLMAGYGAGRPGASGGTVSFAGAPKVTVKGPIAAVSLTYNPVSYDAPTDYALAFTLSEGAALSQRMLVYPSADKFYDGSTNVSLSGLVSTQATGGPSLVNLVAGGSASATFDTAAIGSGIGVTFSGYSLGGQNAGLYALPVSCCAPVSRTFGSISAAPPVVTPPPVVAPPVVVTPPVVTPPVVPPVVVPPVVVTPPVVPPVVEVPPVILPVAPTGVVEATPQTSAFPRLAFTAGTLSAIPVLQGAVNMPLTQLAQLAPQAAPAPLVAEQPAPALAEEAPYVAPVYRPKQDRN